MADERKRQELISKASKERLEIAKANEESLKREKENLKEMVRLNQELTKTQQKKYDAIVKSEKKEEAIKKKKEKQLEVEKKQLAESQRKDKLDNNHAKNLTKLVQVNRKNQGFSKNMFGLSSKVNTLAKDNVALINEENKNKSFSADLSQTLTEATMELASGNLDLLGLKDQEKALQEELIGLDAEKDAEAIKAINRTLELNQIEQDRKKITESVNEALKQGDSLIGGMGGKIKGFVMNPMTAIVALAIAFGSQLAQIGDEFGAMGVTEFRSELMGASAEFTRIGLEGKEAGTSARALADNFGIAFDKSIALADSVGDLAKSTGMATADSAKLVGLFTEIGGLSEKGAVELAKQAESLAVANGVAPNTVLKDIADNAETFAKFSGTGAQGLARAAIQARKLGVEFSAIAGAAEASLDFQSSLNAEVEASVLLGRNLNLQKARELSLAGDIEGFQKEILKQVGSQAEFDKMNVLQKNALAKATGLTVEQLSKMVSKEKEAVTLQGALAKQNIGDIVPEKTIDAFAQLVNQMKAVGIELANSLGPVFMGFGKTVSTVLGFLESFKGVTILVGTALAAMTVNTIAAAAATTKKALATLGMVAAKEAETAALTKNQMVERAGFATSIKSIALGMKKAIVGFFNAASLASTASFGFGTLVFTAIAALAVGAMLASLTGLETGTPLGGVKQNSIEALHAGETILNKDDTAMLASSLSAVRSGGSTTVNTDTSSLEKQGVETNKKLDNLITAVLDNPSQIGKKVTRGFNSARNQ